MLLRSGRTILLPCWSSAPYIYQYIWFGLIRKTCLASAAEPSSNQKQYHRYISDMDFGMGFLNNPYPGFYLLLQKIVELTGWSDDSSLIVGPVYLAFVEVLSL